MAEYQATINLHGRYECGSGSVYKYYGKCTSWMPGAESGWEVSLFHDDKVFTSDGVHDSPDVLVKLTGVLVKVHIDGLHEFAVSEVEKKIEKWDAGRK